MFRKIGFFWIALALVCAVLAISPIAGIAPFAAHPVEAGGHPQVVYQTPTARPDGRVIYVVQANDTCLRIQLLTGATIEQLRTLNKLDQNCTINPGQELLLVVITPVASPTPNPLISPTPLLPTTTPQKGSGQICVTLYNDINGNAVHESNEGPIAGGAASLTDRLGTISKTISTTEDTNPICEEVPEGEYTISMAIPSGYNPTKAMNATVKVQAGDQAIFEFGAQESSSPQGSGSSSPAVKENNSLPLAILGGLLVLFGIGLGGYILFTRRAPAG
jgi:LysM repeat protein